MKDQLEAVFGPLEEALESARQAILDSSRCRAQAAGILDGDNINAEEFKKGLEAAGAKPVRDTIIKAVDKCAAIDKNVEAMTECVNYELSVTCSAAEAVQQREERAKNRPQRPQRAKAVAGRPSKVGRIRLPAKLTAMTP